MWGVARTESVQSFTTLTNKRLKPFSFIEYIYGQCERLTMDVMVVGLPIDMQVFTCVCPVVMEGW